MIKNFKMERLFRMEGRTRGSEVKAVGQEAESDRTSLKMEEEGRNGPCCSRL